MFTEQEIEKLWKPFLALFIVSFLVINWADVSWLFNYRVISGLALSPFQTAVAEEIVASRKSAPRQGKVAGEAEIAASLASTLVPRNDNGSEFAPQQGNIQAPRQGEVVGDETQEASNSIEIPKIGISAPLIFVSNSSNGYLHKKLDSGVVHFPGSVKPGENGETIVLGHSAPANWPKIKYDWVFSDLNKLNPGDQIILSYNNQKYVYSVTRKVFLNKGQEMPENDLTNNNNTLISISCWPPGKDYKRIAVESILIR